MTVVTISGRQWILGDLLGDGGFGQVYAAQTNGEHAAIKIVPKAPGANRELLLAGDLTSVQQVVPVLGIGETADSWCILMPKADESLDKFLKELNRPLNILEALPILLDIATALVGISEKGVVHRDLKPANVLHLHGTWCLSDFGVSRYAEASTSPETRKYSFTPSYAAPEQWLHAHATSVTDVYALGIIICQLLTGKLPFPGPDIPDFREQHLQRTAPLLEAGPVLLRHLAAECLYKAPQARPQPGEVFKQLMAIDGPQAASP